MIRAFATHGSITAAAKEARINRRTHSRWLKADPDYRTKFNEAKQIYIDRLEEECDRRAVEGVVRQRFYKGEPIVLPCSPDEPGAVQITRDDGSNEWVRPYFERQYSDNLLMFRLMRLDPRYRERLTVTTHQTRTHTPEPLPIRGSLHQQFRDRLTATAKSK